MLNAGLSPEEIIYAFGNRKELLSVVAMCDMSKLSEGFKTVLKDAGMPENVLNMKTNNAVSQNTYTPQQVRTNTQTITNAIVQKGGVGYAPSTNGQYKNLYSTAMMLNSIAETYEYVSGSNGTSSKNETKTN